MNILIILSLLQVCLYASAQAVIEGGFCLTLSIPLPSSLLKNILRCFWLFAAEEDSEISGGGGFSEERVKELLDDSLALVPTEPTGSFMTIFKPRNNYWQINCTTSTSNFTCEVQVANLRATVQTITQVSSLKLRVVYLINLVNVNKCLSVIIKHIRSLMCCLRVIALYYLILESRLFDFGIFIWINWRNSQCTEYPIQANSFIFCWEYNDLIINWKSDYSEYTFTYKPKL